MARIPTFTQFALGLLTLTFVIAPSLRAHAQGGTPAAATSTHNAEATGDVGKYANWDQMAGRQHGSLMLKGNVVVAGGQLPWDPIPIVVVCGETPRYNTQSDPKGGFRIEAAPRESEIVTVKSDSKSPNPSQLIGCKVRAELGGFQSSTLNIANRTIEDDSDLGTITLTRDEKTPGSAVSSTTAAAPKDVLKSYDKARSEANSNHPENAQKELEKAVRAYPQFAEAWYELGKLEETQKQQEALNAYSKAVAADPQFYPPYEHIAAIAAQQKKWQDVADAADQGLKLNPAGTPQLWYFSAVGNFNLGHADVAEKSANTSLAMDPSHKAPNTEQLLAVILAAKGDYSGALKHLRSCLSYTAPGPNADLMKQQVAQLEKMVPPAAH
jgi:tetratricopeptide (TPR) repeat protein